MSIADVTKSAESKMAKTLESLQTGLTKIRTGRASTGILDHVQVEYYGSMVPVSQVANVTLIDAQTVGVTAWEKGMTQAIDKAIRESDLGLNPAAVGDILRVPMPALSEERRRELTKVVRAEGEGAKVAVRNLRRDANDHFKKLLKDKEISEDEERRGQDAIQKLTDKSVAEIDKVLDAKEQEIMTV
ncbi:MAG: ribosome recycling factor [Burkholderiaceae bacterium]